jgi:hypothetical protein
MSTPGGITPPPPPPTKHRFVVVDRSCSIIQDRDREHLPLPHLGRCCAAAVCHLVLTMPTRDTKAHYKRYKSALQKN